MFCPAKSSGHDTSESEEGEVKEPRKEPDIDSPEEIQMWLNSRRENFPTRMNILRKLTAELPPPDQRRISRMEIRLRERLSSKRLFPKRRGPKRASVANNQTPEEKLVLQCINYLVESNYFDEP